MPEAGSADRRRTRTRSPTEIRAGKRASDGGLPVGERVQVRLLSADPASGIRFQLLTHQP